MGILGALACAAGGPESTRSIVVIAFIGTHINQNLFFGCVIGGVGPDSCKSLTAVTKRFESCQSNPNTYFPQSVIVVRIAQTDTMCGNRLFLAHLRNVIIIKFDIGQVTITELSAACRALRAA